MLASHQLNQSSLVRAYMEGSCTIEPHSLFLTVLYKLLLLGGHLRQILPSEALTIAHIHVVYDWLRIGISNQGGIFQQSYALLEFVADISFWFGSTKFAQCCILKLHASNLHFAQP